MQLATNRGSKKNILVFCPFYSPRVGGLENYSENLNLLLSNRGYSVLTFTPLVTPGSAQDEQTRAGRILRFPSWEIIHNYPVPKIWHPVFWRQVVYLMGQPTDIVVSHTRFFLTSPMAMIFSKIGNLPWVHIEHGSDFVHLDSRTVTKLAKIVDLTLSRLVLRSANAIVAISYAAANFVKGLAPKQQPRVIYRNIDYQKIENVKSARELRELYPNKTIIIFVGRLVHGKGVVDLINAVSKMNAHNIVCLIVGDGPQKKELLDLVKNLELQPVIKFPGEMPWADCIAYLKVADIAVNPSYTEGMPTSVIEAALCETSIVATSVGGTPEILASGKNALLVPPGQVNKLAEALDTLAHNEPLRDKYSARARKDVQDKFACNNFRQYEEIFDRVTANK